MICKLSEQNDDTISNSKLDEFLNQFPTKVIKKYAGYLKTQPKLESALITYFENKNNYNNITPLIIYNEYTNEVVTLMLNNNDQPDDTGEEGSILAYVRANGYSDSFMCSDCYGQLSCSSCAVEVLTGTLENPFPREEEYDMLDIDDTKPPTEKTRLGCQAKIGTTPLLVKIRAPEKQLISTI